MKKLAVLTALLAAAAACVKTPAPEFAWDKAASFANVKTFAWYDGPPFQYPHGGSIVDGRFIDEHVRRDVETELTRKGFRKDESGSPDVFVSYHTSPDGIVDHDVWGQYHWWSQSIHVSSNYYKEGTLALDVRDGGKKLVWRGVVTRVVGRNPEELAETIERAVRDLLEKFPPGVVPR